MATPPRSVPMHRELHATPIHKERIYNRKELSNRKLTPKHGPERKINAKCTTKNVKLGPLRREIDHDGVVCTVNSSDDNLSDVDIEGHDTASQGHSQEEHGDEQPGDSYSSDSDQSSCSSSTSEDDDQIKHKLQNDPQYKHVLDSLIAEKLKHVQHKENKRKAKRLSKGKNFDIDCTPAIGKIRSPMVKSPSDSTLYTPALKMMQTQGHTQGHTPSVNNDSMIETISSFIDKMKVQFKGRDSDAGHSQHCQGRIRSVQREVVSGTEAEVDDEVDDTQHKDHEKRAKAMADKVIIESERFKAGLITPKGNDLNFQLPMRVDSQIELM